MPTHAISEWPVESVVALLLIANCRQEELVRICAALRLCASAQCARGA